MGGSSSKRSAASDAGSNLLWSLEQLAMWEERLSEDEIFLHAQLQRAPSSSSATSSSSVSSSSAIPSTKTDIPSQIPSDNLSQRTSYDTASSSAYPTSASSTMATNVDTNRKLSHTEAFVTAASVPQQEAEARGMRQAPTLLRAAEVGPGDRGTVSTGVGAEYNKSMERGADVGGDARQKATAFNQGDVYGTSEPTLQRERFGTERRDEIQSLGTSGDRRAEFDQPIIGATRGRDIPDAALMQTSGTSGDIPDQQQGRVTSAETYVPTVDEREIRAKQYENERDRRMFGSDQSESVTYDENVFLPQKFHFAYEALQRLVAGAERNFRLASRVNFIRQRKYEAPMEKFAADKKVDGLNQLLSGGLASWDNAVVAVDWLKRDYELALRWVQLADQLNRVQGQRSTLHLGYDRPKMGNTDEDRKAYDAWVSEQKSKTGALLSDTNGIRQQLANLSQEIAAHQRESLSVGLLFLDRNMSGAIEAEDIPELETDLFAILDVRGKHTITVNELQATLDKMLGEVIAKEKQLRDMDVEIGRDREALQQRELASSGGFQQKEQNEIQKMQAELLKKQENYSNLFIDLKQRRRVLDRVYHVFGQSFLRQVLKKLDTPMDEVVERVRGLMISKKQEEHGITTSFTVTRQWQPPVDV